MSHTITHKHKSITVNWETKETVVHVREENYTVPTITEDMVNAEINRRLICSDWTVDENTPLGLVDKTEWKTYRQTLQNVVSQENYPSLVEWPQAPEISEEARAYEDSLEKNAPSPPVIG